MKKLLAAIFALVLLISISACTEIGASGTPAEPAVSDVPAVSDEPVASSEPIGSSEPADAPEASDQASPAASEDASSLLGAILDEISNDMHPGTAGSSLVSARLAGELLDLQASSGILQEEATDAVKNWFAELDSDRAELLQEQLDSVYVSAQELLSSGAQDLLSSAGYEPKCYPWEERDMYDIFESIYNGAGLEMPR